MSKRKSATTPIERAKDVADEVAAKRKADIMDTPHDGYGMPPLESGFYWFYTLDSDGNRLESTPGICQYRSDTNEVNLIGYDVPVKYDYDRYELIAKAVWEQQVENCETCNGEGSPMGCGECGA